MKTMFVIADYAANYPGNFIASLLALEKKLEGEISLVYFFRDGSSEGYLNWVVPFAKEHECHRISFDEKGREAINKMIDERQPSFLYFHFGGLVIPYQVYRHMSKSQRSSIKMIRHIHSNPTPSGGIKGRIKHLASKYLIPSSLSFIACSEDAYRIIKATYRRQKAYLSPNKIDFSRISFNPGKQPSLEKSMTALTFCYDYYVKGGDIAAATAKKLKEKHPSFRLLMVVASHEEEVRAHLKDDFPDYEDYIDILPPSNDVAKVYALSPVYFLPSRTEGFAYARVEAAYSGLTVICSDLPTLRDVNLPRVRFFKVGDSDEASRLIEEAYISEAEQAERSAFDEYDLSAWADKEAEIIKEIGND